MAALPLLAFVLLHATPTERTAIEKAVREGELNPVTAFLGGPPGPLAAVAAALGRALASRPTAWALDMDKVRRVPFPLKALRGREHEVDWPAGQWRRFEQIEVEVADAPTNPAKGRTGAPGAPHRTSMYLIERQFEARARARPSQLADTLADEARWLLQWAIDNHADLPAPTEKTIKNTLREPYRSKARDRGP